MTRTHADETRTRTRVMPRGRGATSGVLLVALGIWGAIVPFVGPYFSFGYTPDSAWTWTAARGWYEVLPGAVVAFAGLLMVVAASRGVLAAACSLAIAAGAWLVVGPQLAGLLGLGAIGVPVASSTGMRALETLAYFYALGALIVLLAAAALGRSSVAGVAYSHVERERVEEYRPVASGEPSARTSAREAIDREQNDHAHRHFLRSRRAAPAERESTEAGTAPR